MVTDKTEPIHVLFVSKLCSEQTYRNVVEERTKASLDPSQRLFSAVARGLTENGCELTCLSVRPFSANNTDKAYYKREEETTDGIKFIYPAFRVSPLKRMLDLYRNTRLEVKKWIRENGSGRSVILCDSLVAMSSRPARRLGEKSGIKTVAYVTDYPTLATTIKGKQGTAKMLLQKAFDLFAAYDLKKYDGYILVSKHLKELIKPKEKPCTVIEDVIITDGAKCETAALSDQFTLLYGGALCERFGVNKLADTLRYLPNDGIRLVFFGSGESVAYLENIAQTDKRLRYGGVLPFAELQKEQKKADILVNPRPSGETFAKYSFPSKTLSYMLSGTPVLSTRIPGIPEDYDPYLFWFDKEDTASMAEKIRQIAAMPRSALQAKGLEAYGYVINSKNPLVQGKKITDFLWKAFFTKQR